MVYFLYVFVLSNTYFSNRIPNTFPLHDTSTNCWVFSMEVIYAMQNLNRLLIVISVILMAIYLSRHMLLWPLPTTFILWHKCLQYVHPVIVVAKKVISLKETPKIVINKREYFHIFNLSVNIDPVTMSKSCTEIVYSWIFLALFFQITTLVSQLANVARWVYIRIRKKLLWPRKITLFECW